MLEELKSRVLEANLELVRKGLVIYTWGNVSGIDRASGLVAIKPSGVPYGELRAEDIVLVELETGSIAEGRLRPSSDTPTHLELYRRFAEIGGIAHTHSRFATSFAQAKKEIVPLGTTHADHFGDSVPCTRDMTADEIAENYEINTGRVIVETVKERTADAMRVQAVLVCSHGPFTWGEDAAKAAENAAVLEYIAEMQYYSMTLSEDSHIKRISDSLLDRHFNRKHGPKAYYGQRKPLT